MNIKVNFDKFDIKETHKNNIIKILMLKGEKGEKGDGETNIIETVKVNGTTLPVEDKAVNVPIPTNVSSFNNDSGYLIENDLQMVKTTDIENGSQITDATGYSRLNKIYGDTLQNGTPTTENPIDIEVVTGDINVTISNGDNSISQNFLLSLNNMELCKIGTYKDYIYYDNNNWYKYKTIGKLVFNGSENWEMVNSSSGKRFQIGISNIIKTTPKNTKSQIFSTYFKAVSSTNTWNNVVGISYRNVNVGGFYIYDGVHTVLNDFKTWLSSNNVTVYYILSNPINEKITDSVLIEQLNQIRNAKLYEQETNFLIVSNGLLPTLNITYAITNRDIYSKEETDDLISDAKNEADDLITNLDKQINSSNYYDEINYVQERHYNTDCYIATIPKYDNESNPINVYVDSDSNKTPNQYAVANKTTLTTNAGLTYQNAGGTWKQGIVIGNGEILNAAPSDITYRDDNVYIGFTEDRRVLEYQANITTAEQMLNDGIKNAFLVFYRYMNNGQLEEHTEVPNWTTESPRMDFGVKGNGDIIILACDGRTDNNIGLTNEQALEVMLSKGCVRAWRGDGGGSTSLNIKENKINRNIDDNGTTDRKITVNFNVKKQTANEEVANVYGEISKQKQLLNKQLRDDFNSKLNNMSSGLSYQESKIYLKIDNNSLNNISDTNWSTIKLEGKYRHGNNITTYKDENDKIIGFNLNKNGLFRIVVVATYESNGAGEKVIKITKGASDASEWVTTTTVSENTRQYRQIVCETVVNNSTGNVMPIKLWKKGTVGDRWLRITAYCEDLGYAEN